MDEEKVAECVEWIRFAMEFWAREEPKPQSVIDYFAIVPDDVKQAAWQRIVDDAGGYPGPPGLLAMITEEES